MIYRWFGNHFTLVFLTLGIMVVGAGTMTEQITFLSAHLDTNFIPTEVEMEGNIVILLACFGVFLEHRRYLLAKIYPDGLPEPVQRFDHASHHIGVMFILIAIVTEFLDLLFLALNSWGFVSSAVQFTEIATLFAINAGTFVCLAIFALWVLKERPRDPVTAYENARRCAVGSVAMHKESGRLVRETRSLDQHEHQTLRLGGLDTVHDTGRRKHNAAGFDRDIVTVLERDDACAFDDIKDFVLYGVFVKPGGLPGLEADKIAHDPLGLHDGLAHEFFVGKLGVIHDVVMFDLFDQCHGSV